MQNEHDEMTTTGAGANLLPWMRALLTTTGARWQRLTETLPHELLTRIPAPGEWSAVDCLRHLLETERYVFPVRIRAFLAGQDIAAFDPDEDQTGQAQETPAQLAAAFASAREENLVLLARVTEADLDRTAKHSYHGLVTLREMLHEWAAHDLNHTIQAERALMQPFIAGFGPWRPDFAEHVVQSASR